MPQKKRKIIVVGGGPAGMMAAIRAGEMGQDVLLVEKNPVLGKKLLITGSARCNLTNTYDLETFISKVPGNSNFLRSAFKKMFNNELIDFFKKRGVQFVVEKGSKVFPASGKSRTVLDVLVKELKNNGVKIYSSVKMTGIAVEKGKIKALKRADAKALECDRIIIATGGITYPATGSTGDGFKVAEKLGHKIIDPRPALVPLETVEKYTKRLEGLSFEDIKLKFSTEEKKTVSLTGDLIFTASGISGPVVLSLSGTVAEWLAEKRKVYVEIDLMPGLSEKDTENLLIKTLRDNPGKSVKNALRNILPARIVDLFLMISDITPDKNAGNITREERKTFSKNIKKFTLNIKKIKGADHAVVTKGGVSLKEIDPRTMESKKIKGLYFAGEVIDIAGDTGGFNLQIAFSTGYLAGESASINQKIENRE